MNSIAKQYVHLLKTYPAITKITSGGILVGIGDVISQKLIEKKQILDTTRTLRFAGIAFFVITPCTRTWVDIILPKMFKEKKATTKLALKKMLADILLYGPIVTTLQVGLNMYLSGEVTKEQFLPKMIKEQPSVIFCDWIWWGPMQFINFRYIPLHLQASYIQVASVAWYIFLSWLAHYNLEVEKNGGEGFSIKNLVKKDKDDIKKDLKQLD